MAVSYISVRQSQIEMSGTQKVMQPFKMICIISQQMSCIISPIISDPIHWLYLILSIQPLGIFSAHLVTKYFFWSQMSIYTLSLNLPHHQDVWPPSQYNEIVHI